MGFVSMQEDIQDRRDDASYNEGSNTYCKVSRSVDQGCVSADNIVYCSKCGTYFHKDAIEQHTCRQLSGRVKRMKPLNIFEIKNLLRENIETRTSKVRFLQMDISTKKKSRKKASKKSMSISKKAHNTSMAPSLPLKPKESVPILLKVLSELGNRGDWTSIDLITQKIQRQFLNFRAEDYGHRNLTSLFRALTEDFETKSDKEGVLVRINGVKKEDFTGTSLCRGLFRHYYDIGYCAEDKITGVKFQCRTNESATRKMVKLLAKRMYKGEEVEIFYRASRKEGHNIALEIRPI